MNYLTNYYKNLSEQLQGKINLLESQARELNGLRQLNEAPEAYDMANGYGTQANPFSGGYLGSLLGQGNMADVYNYLGQFGGGAVPGGMSALTSGRRSVNRRGLESAGGGAPRGAGSAAFSGANLGQLLGQGNMNAVNNYLANYGNNGAYQAGAALRAYNSPSANRGNYENAGGGAPRGAGTSPFSGANLGQLLGQGNMNSVNNYLANYGGNGAYQAGAALRASNRPSANRGGYEGAGSGVNPMSGDYNGDGRVDGADLGLALGSGQNSSGVINSWTSPYSAAGPAFLRTSPGVQSQGGGGYDVGGGYGESPTAAGASPAGGGVSRPKVYGYAGSGAPRGGGGGGGGAYGGGGVDVGGGYGEGSGPSVGGPAGGGAPSGSGFGVAGRDLASAPRTIRPTLGGPAGGYGGAATPSYSPNVGGAANDNAQVAIQNATRPPLTDLNGDGVIDGSDLGRYMDIYGFAPPYFQQGGALSPTSWIPGYGNNATRGGVDFSYAPTSVTRRKR